MSIIPHRFTKADRRSGDYANDKYMPNHNIQNTKKPVVVMAGWELEFI